MGVLPSVALFLAAQLLLSTALAALAAAWFARRRRSGRIARARILSWLDAARVLHRLLPWTVSIAGAAAAAQWLLDGGVRLEPAALLFPGLTLGVSSVTPTGVSLALEAGRRERRGRLRSARRLVRLGGRMAFVGSGLQLIVLFVVLLGQSAAVLDERLGPAMVPLLAGAILLGLSGFAGLLAGLSGKPRPSAQFAALLYLAALLTLTAVAGAA